MEEILTHLKSTLIHLNLNTFRNEETQITHSNIEDNLRWKKTLKKNKKVLLRECKRHTARRVVSTPSVVLTGYPPLLTWQGGT